MERKKRGMGPVRLAMRACKCGREKGEGQSAGKYGSLKAGCRHHANASGCNLLIPCIIA